MESAFRYSRSHPPALNPPQMGHRILFNQIIQPVNSTTFLLHPLLILVPISNNLAFQRVLQFLPFKLVLNWFTIILTPTAKDKHTKYCVITGKPYIVISSRVHPSESNASWIIKGILLLLFLCSDLLCKIQ